MPINVGYIEGSCGEDIVVRIYYDATWLTVDPNRDPNLAPLINGPRGYCLDITNTSGRKSSLTASGVTGNPINMAIQQGNPVTTGPQSGRSRTAAQMSALGFTTRGSVGNVQISCN